MASSHATLIVKQPGHHGITNEETFSALTEEALRGDRPIVELDMMAEALRAIESEDSRVHHRGAVLLLRPRLQDREAGEAGHPDPGGPPPVPP